MVIVRVIARLVLMMIGGLCSAACLAMSLRQWLDS